MRIGFFLWGLLAIGYGLFSWVEIKIPLHEIIAGVAFLIATVAWGISSLIDEIRDIRKE